MAHEPKKKLTVREPFRHVAGLQVVPGTYRIGPVYVAVELDEIDRMSDAQDFVGLIQKKLAAAQARVIAITDVDDFAHLAGNAQQRTGTLTDAAGPLARAGISRETGDAE